MKPSLSATLCCAVLLISVSPVYADFPTIKLVPISEGDLVAPVSIRNAGDGTGRLFTVDQRGKIQIIDANGNLEATPFLDIGAKLVPQRANFDERGLLGLAFHPNYSNSGQPGEGKFYVYYSATSPNAPGTGVAPVDHMSVVAEYSVSAGDPDIADILSERILFTLDQPQFNHDGGDLAFGPSDDLLYIALGDGGSSDDNNAGHTGGDSSKPDGVLGNAQDLTNLFGSILRIDPLGNNGPGGEYGIPPGNPHIGEGGGVREEIYAHGLRNPWRISFDDGPGGTNRLFVADVGQRKVEEINIVELDDNMGWRNKEGSFDFDTTAPGTGPFVDPVAEYAHPNENIGGLRKIGLSVTGGYVYRGSKFSTLQGKYLFGDYSTGFQTPDGTLLGLEEASPGVFELSVLEVVGGNPIGQYITAFGEDEDGEIYVATRTTLAPVVEQGTNQPTGAIYRIEPVTVEITSVLEPLKDNSIFEENDNSNGKGEWIFSGTTRNNQERRALIKFDVENQISSFSEITSASLSLQMDMTIAGAIDYELRKLSLDWGEGLSDATGEEGKGASPTVNDATWNFNFHNSGSWAIAGADFSGTQSATTSVNGNGSYQWNSSQLAQDVEDWLSGDSINHGWILLTPNTAAETAKRFRSRESAVAAERPKLTVTYLTDVIPFYQPDGTIQENGKSPRGNNRYNLGAASQTIKLKGRSNSRFKHRFGIQNDGNMNDSFSLRNTKGNGFFKVKYFQLTGGKRNVTGLSTRGTLLLNDLAPGETVSFEAQIKTTRKARNKSRKRRFFHLSRSVTAPTKADRTKADLKTKK